MSAALRVCVGPLEIAGIAANLVAGLRADGVSAQLLLHTPHRFGYERHDADVDALLPRWWRRLGAHRRDVPASRRVAKALVVIAHRALGWLVLGWALPRYDAFVFLYAETFTNTAFELRLLRALKRRTVMIFVGSDARPPAIDGARFPAGTAVSADALLRATRAQAARVRRIEALVDVCINAPATAQFHRRPVVDWFAFGLPRLPSAPRPAEARIPGSPLVIVHAPSYAMAKGSAQIAAAVERLRGRGIAVEFVALEGRTNAEVLAEIARCDLVVDQLWSDTPMAGFAAEAAALGKPVLVAGYFAAQVREAFAQRPLPPTSFVVPEDFEAALERLVRDPALRESLGAQGREFVATHWHAQAVAGRLLCLLRGDVPRDWWLDPRRLSYVHGCGLAAAVASQRLRALIDHGGTAALEVHDKPELEAAFVALAGGVHASAPVQAQEAGA